MDEQLSLLDSAKPELKHSIYFALRAGAGLGGEIIRYRDDIGARHRIKGALVPEERLHLTLLDVGTFAGLPPRLADVLRAGEAASELIAPFEFLLTHVQAHPNGVLMLTPDGQVPLLKTLREELQRQMVRQGLKGTGSFRPHVTLAYLKQRLPKEAIGPLTWPVTEIALIHSIENQPEVTELGRWPLSGK